MKCVKRETGYEINTSRSRATIVLVSATDKGNSDSKMFNAIDSSMNGTCSTYVQYSAQKT